MQSGDQGQRFVAAPTPPVDGSLTPAQTELHDGFVKSVQTLRTDLVRTMLLLCAVAENRVHRALGFTNLADYAQLHAGFTPRQTRDMLQLGRKLRSLHQVAAAVDSGRLPWTKAREICRVARPEDQQQYIDLAQAVSRRELQQILSGGAQAAPVPVISPPRSLPQLAPRDSAPAIAPEHCYVTLRFTPEQHARWTALLAASGHSGATAELLLEALSAPARGHETTGPHYLVVLLHCPSCRADAIVTSRGEAPAPAPLVAAAGCDAVVEDDTGRQRATIAPRQRRRALQRARHRCEATGCSNTQYLEIHHRQAVAAGGRDDLENLVVLCSRCHRSLHAAEQQAHDDARGAHRAARELFTQKNCQSR